MDQTANAMATGYEALDQVLGGGWPRGRVSQFFGPGSDVVRNRALRAAQHARGVAAIIDCARRFDVLAVEDGIQVDRLLVSQPDTREQAIEITTALTRSGAVDLIVLDGWEELPSDADPRIVRPTDATIDSALGALSPIAFSTRTTLLINGRPAVHERTMTHHASARVELTTTDGVIVAIVFQGAKHDGGRIILGLDPLTT